MTTQWDNDIFWLNYNDLKFEVGLYFGEKNYKNKTFKITKS